MLTVTYFCVMFGQITYLKHKTMFQALQLRICVVFRHWQDIPTLLRNVPLLDYITCILPPGLHVSKPCFNNSELFTTLVISMTV